MGHPSPSSWHRDCLREPQTIEKSCTKNKKYHSASKKKFLLVQLLRLKRLISIRILELFFCPLKSTNLEDKLERMKINCRLVA